MNGTYNRGLKMRYWLLTAFLLVFFAPAHAEITAKDFDLKECHWRHSLDSRDCESHRNDPAAFKKYIAYLNSLPGKTDLEKMTEDMRRFCKQKGYRGGAPGERIQIVDYCSTLDGFYPEQINVIRSTEGETWVFRKGFNLLYVDRQSGMIKQVVTSR